MSKSSKQSALVDFADGGDDGLYPCPVCGLPRTDGFQCHEDGLSKIEYWLNRRRHLFPTHRYEDYSSIDSLSSDSACSPIIFGDDRITFLWSYLALQSIGSEIVAKYEQYAPYKIPRLEWVTDIYRNEFLERDLIRYQKYSMERCVNRVQQYAGTIDPVLVFAHLIYLDQFGLIPRYTKGDLSFREICAHHLEIDLPIEALQASDYLVQRRIDRRKVWSTTREFRTTYDLVLV